MPPVSCIVSDAAMFFTLDAVEELGVPEVLFWTASACGFLVYTQYEKLIQLGLVPFKDTSFLTNGLGAEYEGHSYEGHPKFH